MEKIERGRRWRKEEKDRKEQKLEWKDAERHRRKVKRGGKQG